MTSYFFFLKDDSFDIKKQKDGEFLVSSTDKFHWMFRLISKKDIDRKFGKPRIEVWRYISNQKDKIDKGMMVLQCNFHLEPIK
jgi:hypothetical protein